MADTIVLINALTITATTTQLLAEAMDFSMYDEASFQVAALNVNNVATGGGVTVEILSSMQNKSDDGSWVSVATVTVSAGPPGWGTLSIPGAGTLFRYIRYRVSLSGTATTATVSVSGLARRRSL